MTGGSYVGSCLMTILTGNKLTRPGQVRGGKKGCLENFLHRGHCHRFEMPPIPQVLNVPGDPIWYIRGLSPRIWTCNLANHRIWRIDLNAYGQAEETRAN
jgi:hypothetical protein